MFTLFKKKPKKRFREFGARIETFMRASDVAQKLLQRANELGLQGKKIDFVIRQNIFDSNRDEIWFEGEK